MITHICDRCCRPLAKKSPRYVVKIQVYAAADPLEITAEDLQTDSKTALQEAMEKAAGQTEAEAMRDVYVELQYDLCRPCQQAYLMQPIPPAKEIS
jgi:hypothetical protein